MYIYTYTCTTTGLFFVTINVTLLLLFPGNNCECIRGTRLCWLRHSHSFSKASEVFSKRLNQECLLGLSFKISFWEHNLLHTGVSEIGDPDTVP